MEEDQVLEQSEKENNSEKQFGLDPKEDYSDIDEITARIMARKQEALRRKKKARIRRRIVFGLILLLIGGFVFSISSFFVVDSIEVKGNSYFTGEEIINMAHAMPGKNLIYHPDKRNIVAYLEKNPYIKNAKVTRSFPSTLVINVEERVQLGAIKYDDEFLIIDGEGILLRKTKTRPKLTEIEGLIVRKIQPGEMIGVKDEELLGQTLSILKGMKAGDLYFVRLDMREMYIKAYVFESLICKGTYKQLNTFITNGRLHRVLDKLLEDNVSRGMITFSNEGYASFVPTV